MTIFFSKPIGIVVIVTLVLASILLIMDIAAWIKDFRDKRKGK